MRAFAPRNMCGMCGIVGYVGPRESQPILIAGLSRLEYRGYDSAGIAVIDGDGNLGMRKHAGKLSVLRKDLDEHPLAAGTTGIGHTRWATHGGPTDANAHPHLADDDKLALIHNGIIENFAAIKSELREEGFAFRSETDTEVAAVLLGREYRAHGGDLVAAFRSVVRRLDGAFEAPGPRAVAIETLAADQRRGRSGEAQDGRPGGARRVHGPHG